uniref:amine sulfotransferase-like n=1 Tax=Panthera onca TaxID=9690 RepID=UPI002953BCC5|nr:amine sulfotransferase-like [Panthera onca]
MEDADSFLFKFKGYHFGREELDIGFIENLDDFVIRESDVFIITYPKSENTELVTSVCPVFVLYTVKNERFRNIEYFLSLQIIYIYRNPKDVMCSYFHFSKNVTLQVTSSFEEFMEQFLEGKVLGSLWFDHIKGWYEHKSLFNIQFLMYEEMKKDLKGSLSKVCKFLGKELSEEEMDAIVRQATFQNMKYDPRANYKNIIKTRYGLEAKGHFLRKGTIGDWKNHMTVEQNERFDKIFQRKMKDFPLKFIWDMNEE